LDRYPVLPFRALLTSRLDWVADCPAAGRSRRLTKSKSASPRPGKATALGIYRSRVHRFERPWGQFRVVRCRSGRKITASCGSTKSFILNFDLIPPGRFANSLEAALDRRHSDSSARAFKQTLRGFLTAALSQPRPISVKQVTDVRAVTLIGGRRRQVRVTLRSGQPGRLESGAAPGGRDRRVL